MCDPSDVEANIPGNFRRGNAVIATRIPVGRHPKGSHVLTCEKTLRFVQRCSHFGMILQEVMGWELEQHVPGFLAKCLHAQGIHTNSSCNVESGMYSHRPQNFETHMEKNTSENFIPEVICVLLVKSWSVRGNWAPWWGQAIPTPAASRSPLRTGRTAAEIG